MVRENYPLLADELPYRQFLDEGVVDLRDEGIAKFFWLAGPSPDVSDNADLIKRSERLGKALSHFHTGDSVQILYDRRPAPEPPELQYSHPAAALVMAEMRERFKSEQHWITPTRLILATQYERPLKSAVRAFFLGGNGPQRLNNHDLLRQDALGRFSAFEDAVKGAVHLHPMTDLNTFRDLLHIVTYRDIPAPLPEPHVRLNHVLACDWQVNGEAPMMGDWHLRPIVISVYPNETLPQLLAPLLEHRGYLTLSIRFRCLAPFDAQKKLRDESAHWEQSAAVQSFRNLFKGFIGWDKSDSQDAAIQIADINDALAESQAGTPFGTVSAVAIVRDKDPDQADMRAHHLMGVLNGRGIVARIERNGAAKAIRSTWPGYLQMKSEEYEAGRHKLKMTGFNFADIAMPATHFEGASTIHSSMFPPNTPTPLVCSGTGDDEPFSFPISVGGVNHILGLGKTGSGKSSWAGLFVCAVLGIPDSQITWLDVGRSSYVLSHLLQARYHNVGGQDSAPLCPLALLDRPNGLQWLMGWFERIYFRRRSLEIDEAGSKDLMNALQDVRMRKNAGVTSGQCRHLLDLYAAIPSGGEQRQRMRAIIKEMVDAYGHIFGGEPHTDVHTNRVTVYELGELDTAPKYISTPAKELIFYNTISRLDGRPSFILFDEFWSIVQDSVSAPWFFQAIRTLRRNNAGFIGLSQSTIDITQSDHRDLLLGNIPSILFFPDSSANTAYVQESFYKLGLNPHEVSKIADAQQGDFYYKSEIGSRLANCWLGPVGQAICTSTSYQQVQLFKQIQAQCPDSNLLHAWLEAIGIPGNDGDNGNHATAAASSSSK